MNRVLVLVDWEAIAGILTYHKPSFGIVKAVLTSLVNIIRTTKIVFRLYALVKIILFLVDSFNRFIEVEIVCGRF